MSRLYDRVLSGEALAFPLGTAGTTKDRLQAYTVVVGDNVARLMWEQRDTRYWDLRTDFPNVAPPLELAWFEFRKPGGEQDGWKEFAVQMQAHDVGPGHPYESPTGQAARWMLSGWVWGPIDVAHVAPLSHFLVPVSETGVILQRNAERVDTVTWINPELRDIICEQYGPDADALVGAWARTAMGTMLMTLCFMHCKNVRLSVVEPPAKLARASLRRHNRPLVRYHILDIEPMRRVLTREGQLEKVGLKRAVHICRGNFAHYTDEHPMFGKFVGTFWRPMHMRGDPRQGSILKDYNVKTEPRSVDN